MRAYIFRNLSLAVTETTFVLGFINIDNFINYLQLLLTQRVNIAIIINYQLITKTGIFFWELSF